MPDKRHRSPCRAPGSRLRRLAQLYFSRKANDEVFTPILNALLDDYCDALAAGDDLLARFVLLRGYGSFWVAVAGRLPVSFITRFFKVLG